MRCAACAAGAALILWSTDHESPTSTRTAERLLVGGAEAWPQVHPGGVRLS